MKRLTLEEIEQIKCILVKGQHFELASRMRDQVPKKIKDKEKRKRVNSETIVAFVKKTLTDNKLK